MTQFLQNTSMNFYNIDDFLKDEQSYNVLFKEEILPTKLYKGVQPGKKIELPVFAIRFLLTNDHCELFKAKKPSESKNLFEKHRNDFYAQADIVNLHNEHFYSFITFYNNNVDQIKNEQDTNNAFLLEIFLKRMGEFSKLMIKETFSEEDVAHLSYEEKNILVQSRKIFQAFKTYEAKLL